MHKSISFVFSLFFNLVTDWLILQCVLLHLPFGNWNRLQLLNWISVGKWMVYFQVNLGDYPLKKKTIVDVLCPADFISTITMICRFAANTWIDPNMTSRQKIYESCGLLRKSIFHSPLSSVIFYLIFFFWAVWFLGHASFIWKYTAYPIIWLDVDSAKMSELTSKWGQSVGNDWWTQTAVRTRDA